MNDRIPSLILQSCPKGYTRDLDKTISPTQTLEKVQQRLQALHMDILASTRRVDTGRLGIPVYMSICGADALKILPTRKQMGKGSSPEQAKASAVMELLERFSFFTFWASQRSMVQTTWQEAKRRFGANLLPIEQILLSVSDNSLKPEQAEEIMDTLDWLFYPATELRTGHTMWLPLDWFRVLNEFNGASAGNSNEESILQGICELIERHVCCQIDRLHPTTPTIDLASCTDSVLQEMLMAFKREGIQLILKDFSLGLAVPTVGVLAWDASTFPEHSEIVFTAGTATSPLKAAIRAVTEVAQLAGDFCTNACYEASGLPKFTLLAQTNWLKKGELVSLKSLPCIEHDDILDELLEAVRSLSPLEAYTVETTHPRLCIPAHYTIVPGFSFRERDVNQSLGLFVGRKLVESDDLVRAEKGLQTLTKFYPEAHFMPFFHGMLALRKNNFVKAKELFETSLPLQPDAESKGMAAFYSGYTNTLQNQWSDALHPLQLACDFCPDMKDYVSLLGVAYFKIGQYARAAEKFKIALKLDKGSAIDLANLGVCEKRLGLYHVAIEHLRTALKLDASLIFARENLEELEQR